MKRGFSNTIMTSDKVQSGTRANHCAQKKAKMRKSKIKTMLICFLESQGLGHKEFAPQGRTVNKQYYREVLQWLRKRIHHVLPEIANTWMLHHGNAPSHCHLRERIFGQKTYFSGSAATILAWPESVWLPPFPKLKFHLKGRHFGTVDNIQ